MKQIFYRHNPTRSVDFQFSLCSYQNLCLWCSIWPFQICKSSLQLADLDQNLNLCCRFILLDENNSRIWKNVQFEHCFLSLFCIRYKQNDEISSLPGYAYGFMEAFTRCIDYFFHRPPHNWPLAHHCVSENNWDAVHNCTPWFHHSNFLFQSKFLYYYLRSQHGDEKWWLGLRNQIIGSE